jgi:hypothetical protein
MNAAKNRDFSALTYQGFRELAADAALSKYEKIGFPDSYRAGYEERIFEDILNKLPLLNSPKKTVVDIGPGCSDLPRLLIKVCEQQGHTLVLLDSEEMLALLPDLPFTVKIPGLFPQTCEQVLEKAGAADVVLCYSVLHYAFVDTSLMGFVDGALSLLRSGGQMLIGDIPNTSMRKRFFASAAGARCHQEYTKSDEMPEIKPFDVEPGKIDDAVVLSILARMRNSGAHAYVVPQDPRLPMANRREDILVRRP